MYNLWQLFEQTVKRVPDRPAIVMGDSQHTFSQWQDRANDFRQRYHAAGLTKGDRVLFWMENNFDMAAALTAAWGNDLIPAFIDVGSRKPQLDHVLATIDPSAIVFGSSTPEVDAGSSLSLIALSDVVVGADAPDIKAACALPTDPASIVFTSGSTGKPKGVVQSHANLYRGCRSVYSALKFNDNDSLLCPVPWSFDYGYGQLLSSIICGVTHVLPKVQNPFGICTAIEQNMPSILAGTPSLYAYLMGGMSPVKTTDLSSLRLLTNTGGTLHKQLISILLDTFGEAELVLNYGLTESYRSCYLPPQLLGEHPGSIGKPIPGVDIVVVREDGSTAKPNEEGEIVHRGDYIFLGYWGNPDATERAIRSDPLAQTSVINGAKALYTGDMGYFDDDGFLYYVGRRDQQLKSMGVRVSPGEVEEGLLNSGMLDHVAVFGLPHDLLGHEIWAAVVPKQADGFEQRRLEQHARSVMSDFMLPRRYILLQNLPRTSTGKVNYVALAESAVQGELKA